MSRIFSIYNLLTALRAPLALFFLSTSPTLRLSSLLLAMISDSIDGYLARKNKRTSQFGAILDAAMDKFYVFFVLGVLLVEGKLIPLQVLAMMTRDIALCCYAIYLTAKRGWRKQEFHSVLWGKVTTALQFVVLICTILGFQIPTSFFSLFIILGILAFIELLKTSPVKPTKR